MQIPSTRGGLIDLSQRDSHCLAVSRCSILRSWSTFSLLTTWFDSELMLVTNGLFLHRFPELAEVLVDTECQLEISQHGTHQDTSNGSAK